MIEMFECPKYVSKIEYVGPHQITTTGLQSYSVGFTINDVCFTSLSQKESERKEKNISKE